MLNLKKCMKIKQVEPKIDIFLAMGMEIFDLINEKKKKNDPDLSIENDKPNGINKKKVDNQLDMEDKVDALIANTDKRKKSEVADSSVEFGKNVKKKSVTTDPIVTKNDKNQYKKGPLSQREQNNDNFKDEIFDIRYNSEFNPIPKVGKNFDDIIKDDRDPSVNSNIYSKKKVIKNKGLVSKNKNSKRSSFRFPHRIRIRRKEEREKLKDRNNSSNLDNQTMSFKNIKFNVENNKISKNNSVSKSSSDNDIIKKEVEKKEIGYKKIKKIELKNNKKELRRTDDDINNLEYENSKKLELKKSRKTLYDNEKEFNESKVSLTKTDGEFKDKNLNPKLDSIITEDKKFNEKNPVLDDDIKKVLSIIDNLLGNLPEGVIDDFVKSEDFALYEKVIVKYKIK